MLNKVSKSLEDQFKQDRHNTVFSYCLCTIYRMYKLDHKFESYLIVLDPVYYKQIVNYRLCNNYLLIETLRWYNVDRNDRTCPLCNCLDVGDEYHYLFACSHFSQLRKQLWPVKILKKYKHSQLLFTNE